MAEIHQLEREAAAKGAEQEVRLDAGGGAGRLLRGLLKREAAAKGAEQEVRGVQVAVRRGFRRIEMQGVNARLD